MRLLVWNLYIQVCIVNWERVVVAATQRRSDGERTAAERILTTASQMFYERGIRPTGVNPIAERAAVTKVTLYAHFGSQDGLVAAHLRARDQRWWAEFDELLADCATGTERLKAMFDAYQAWVLAGDFRGCGFVNAATELTAAGHPGHVIISAHKEAIRRYLEAFAAEAGCTDPAEVADEWFLLLEGATVTASLRHSTEPLHHARRAALRLAAISDPRIATTSHCHVPTVGRPAVAGDGTILELFSARATAVAW